MIAQTEFTLIRRVLYSNAVFSGVNGLLFIFASSLIAKFIGINTPLVILVIEIGLVGYAALIYANASCTIVSRSFVLTAVISDSFWILLSIILLITGWVPFSIQGKWAVGIVAMMVDIFATLQFLEWRIM